MGSELYRKHAAEYARAIQNNAYNSQYERPSLMAMLPSVNNSNVLDMGCGPGLYTQELIEMGAKVTAIDNSPEMIDLVKDNSGDGVRAYVQDLNDGLPLQSDSSFDLVISPLTIHYIEDWRTLFCEIARVLRPFGQFVFSTHHPMMDFESTVSGNYFDTELLTQEWNTIGAPVEVSFYRRPLTELFRAVENAGMNVVTLREGVPTEEMKLNSTETYDLISTTPTFIFVKCKLPTPRS